MGYDLPAAIGACVAAGRRVICLAGDGSIQMNIQELQTIVHHHLPVKIFVFDNQGYLSMRQTQDNLFGGRYVGEGPESGVSLPDMVADRRRLRHPGAPRVSRHDELDEAIAATLAGDGPQLCDVVMDPHQPFAPKVAGMKLPGRAHGQQSARRHASASRPRGTGREHDRARCTGQKRGGRP